MPELSCHDTHTVAPASKLEKILNRLEEYGTVKETGRGWTSFCPLCDPKKQTVTIEKGYKHPVVMRCQKCEADYPTITKTLGIPTGGLEEMPAENGTRPKVKVTEHRTYTHTEYLICDIDGNERLIHHRYDYKDGRDKTFAWTMPDGTERPHGSPSIKDEPLFGMELLPRMDDGCKVLIVEGEKTAVALRKRLFPTLATIGGSGAPPSDMVMRHLKGRQVILWADADEEGVKWTDKMLATCHSLGIRVYLYEWHDAPEGIKGADGADHPAINSGNPEKLKQLFKDVGNSKRVWGPYNMQAGGLVPTAAFVAGAEEKLRQIIENDGVIGWRTGLDDLDPLLRGLVKKEVTVVGAHSGQGKTLFLGQLCLNAALQGARAAYFTTETGAEDILLRIACALSGVRYFGDLKPGKVEPVYETMQFIRESLKIKWDCKAAMTPGHIAEQVERHKPDVVFVDYLQDLSPDPGAPKEERGKYAAFAESLKEISLCYEVPVVVGSQFTKEAGKRMDKDGAPSCPSRHDLFGASELANVASNVVIIHQPERFADKPFHKKTVELVVDKTRHGRQGTVPCRFVQGQQWLTLAPKPPVTYE